VSTGRYTNNNYNKSLQPFAYKLRGEMTKAEACLWKLVLSKKQMKNFQFRRQRPVLNYITDFMCPELKLIVEVDGLTHHWEEVGMKDFSRSKCLQDAGFTIVRFEDNDVLNNIDEVRREIFRYVEELEQRVK